MVRRQTCISLILPVALFFGCFNPDYGDGGFLCTGEAPCPDGYTCVKEDKKEVCRPTGTKKGDGGLITAQRKAPPCDKPWSITPRLMAPVAGVPHTFALALDSHGLPLVFFVREGSKIYHAEYYDSWKSAQVSLADGNMVAAAALGDKAVVVFAKMDISDGHPLFTSYDHGAQKPQWTLAQDVSSGFVGQRMTSMDMAGGKDRLYLAVTTVKTGVVKKYSSQSVEFYGNKFTTVCTAHEGASRYVGARVGASGKGMAYSVFKEGLMQNRKWSIQRNDTSGCKQTTQGIVGLKLTSPLPGPVALDENGNVHLAFPLPVALTNVDLGYLIWDGATDAAPNPQVNWKTHNVVSTSVALALAPSPGTDVVIAYRHSRTGSHGVYLRQKNSAWTAKEVASVEGHSTRVAVDSKGKVHLLYDHTTKQGSALYYRCFQ